MKILLATIVDNVNYGTYLQTFATVKVLEEYGCDMTVLNYERKHLSLPFALRSGISGGLNQCLKEIPSIILDRIEKRNLKKFAVSKCRFTKKFTEWEAFKETLPPYDLYLTGSDQVWNVSHNKGIDPVFFFDGINGVKRSMAASIGMERFPEDYMNSIRNLLNQFDFISVREESACQAIEELGICGVEQILDPTLLLTTDQWLSYSKSSFSKSDPYLLIYSVEKTKTQSVIDTARKIAVEKGLKTYLVTPYPNLGLRNKVDKVFSMADTDTFLNLFANADYVVASSFHGTAFAINFNRQFVTVAPEKFNSRVKSLLKLTDLENRYIADYADLPKNDIDYNPVNKILAQERENSKTIIRNKIIRVK